MQGGAIAPPCIILILFHSYFFIVRYRINHVKVSGIDYEDFFVSNLAFTFFLRSGEIIENGVSDDI